MAKTFTAAFAQTPKLTKCTATTAFALTGGSSLLDDAPANTVLLFTAGSDGSLVTEVKAITRATNTATMAALFLKKSGDGASVRTLIASLSIPAQTVATTVGVVEFPFYIASEATPLRLEASDSLYVGLAVTQADGINFVCKAVDY